MRRRVHIWLYWRFFNRKWDDPRALAAVSRGERVPLESFARWYERPLVWALTLTRRSTEQGG